MNLLMIGSDTTLAGSGAGGAGDSRRRHAEYGRHFSSLFVIVPAKKGQYPVPNRLAGNVTVYPTASRRYLSLVDLYRLGGRLCREHAIDVISVQNPFQLGLVGLALKWRHGIPLNVQLHSPYLDNPQMRRQSPWYGLSNALGKFVVRQADSVRVVSRRIEHHLIDGLNIPRYRVVRFPIAAGRSFPGAATSADLARRFGQSDGVVLYVGRLSREKNVALLLEAAHLVLRERPATLFLVVGDGPERAGLERRAGQPGVAGHVVFEGTVAYERLPAYYDLCAMLVLPSDREGWGRVAAEAMACGRPVIMTDGGCAGELHVDGRTGYVVPAGARDALADRILRLLRDPGLRREMGANASAAVRAAAGDGTGDGQRWRELCERTVRNARGRRRR